MGKLYLIVGVAAFLLMSLPAISGTDGVSRDTGTHVTGEKLDSGLGQLPPYDQWAAHPTLHVLMRSAAVYHVPGEKLDSGLGEMRAYSASR